MENRLYKESLLILDIIKFHEIYTRNSPDITLIIRTRVLIESELYAELQDELANILLRNLIYNE